MTLTKEQREALAAIVEARRIQQRPASEDAVAWMCEVKTMGGWEKATALHKPGEVEDKLRNIRPLYAAPVKPVWRDIASAPKETDQRLLLFANGEVVIGYRNSFYEGSPWFHSDDLGPLCWGVIEPTHWMPLPPAPAGEVKP